MAFDKRNQRMSLNLKADCVSLGSSCLLKKTVDQLWKIQTELV